MFEIFGKYGVITENNNNSVDIEKLSLFQLEKYKNELKVKKNRLIKMQNELISQLIQGGSI